MNKRRIIHFNKDNSVIATNSVTDNIMLIKTAERYLQQLLALRGSITLTDVRDALCICPNRLDSVVVFSSYIELEVKTKGGNPSRIIKVKGH